MLSLSSFARTIVFALAVSAMATITTASAAPEQPAKPRVHTVQIKGMVFVPATLEVSVGDTVIWVNDDFVPHTATAVADGATIFDSGELPANASWKYVTSKSGRIPYVCVLHPTMKGTLIVR